MPHEPISVRDLDAAPELAVLALLDLALQLANTALLAEHPALADDLRRPGEDGVLTERARLVCVRASSLRVLVARYVRGARDAAGRRAAEADTDLPFLREQLTLHAARPPGNRRRAVVFHGVEGSRTRRSKRRAFRRSFPRCAARTVRTGAGEAGT